MVEYLDWRDEDDPSPEPILPTLKSNTKRTSSKWKQQRGTKVQKLKDSETVLTLPLAH
ncbi:hypothetical protein DAPPUDRAFT_241027 [Daphnia pulex]|uniref:Uncharacterized protein n=1 Tax=Daphnia pulex TaxID=6669 RepID=E9GD84_DAPPU|nr:hypothetical protein DAPPUDRAFT_241027 [Daphnia pulex]|eukprot:EFX82691.1 hypothetical protein DAPPUDRAFT_241027 [Daphnia pulex]